VVYRKGELSKGTMDRQWPHQVALPAARCTGHNYVTIRLFCECLAHLGALVALATAIALIMTPAAYHRMALRGKVSRSLIDFASRLIAYAMAAFTMAITLNMFLIGSVVLESEHWGMVLGLLAFITVAGLWFGYPMLSVSRRHEK
jgi:Family of unknown function (DUF6328)